LPNSPTSRGNRNRECDAHAGVEEEIGIGCTGRVSPDAASPAQEGCRAGEGPEGSQSGEGQGSEGRGPLPGGRSCARVFSRRRRREVGRPADRVPRRGAFRSDPKGGATQEGVKILDRLGVYADVERAKDGRHVRAGRGKMRGRRYRQPRSLLVVVKDPAKVRRLFGNLPGVEVVSPAGLSAEVLAPGGDPGRLTMFSEGALEVLRSWSP